MHRTTVQSIERPYLIYDSSRGNEDDSEMQLERFGQNTIKNQNKSSIDVKKDMEEEDMKSSFSWFNASLFAKILENILTEIHILAECNNELRVRKALSDMPLLLTYKYQVVEPGAEETSHDGNIQNLHLNKYKLHKLDADRKYFSEVIMATYLCLNMRKDFMTLKEEINKIMRRDRDQINLIDEEVKNKLLKRELYKQLRQQRNRIKTVRYDANATIENLKIKLEDYSLNVEIQIRYVENWQRARTEQNNQSINDSEFYPSRNIEYYKQRFDQEQRIHAEVVLLINISIDETSRKVEELMNKYDKDMEEIDLKIQYKKNDYQNIREKRLDLESTLEKHDILMNEWRDFKEKREKDRFYIEKMTKSAIIVQAWWRGLLVRRGLGPYKVAIKKGGAKKKSNAR